MHEIRKPDFARAASVFGPMPECFLFCTAVLDGSQPGRIFVDNIEIAKTAFIITHECCAYLVGDPHNEAFNRALDQAIFQRRIVSEKAFGLLLHCYPEDWEGYLASAFNPHKPIADRRRRYICHELKFEWRSRLPPGFDLRVVASGLTDRLGLEVPEDIWHLVNSWRLNRQARLPATAVEHSFGFVVLDRGIIVAHAVLDCVVGDTGDIGLVTAEDCWCRGLATATSRAAIEFGLTNSLSFISWDCSEANLGSVRTAEKLGFELKRVHQMRNFDLSAH